jgi:hypothetical protein
VGSSPPRGMVGKSDHEHCHCQFSEQTVIGGMTTALCFAPATRNQRLDNSSGMDLTRRTSKAISEWFPNEIITQIIEAAPQTADREALCRASKLFHGLCAPILYRTVVLDNFISVAAFCSAVLSNRALAELVRSFTVFKSYSSNITRRVISSSNRFKFRN